MVSLTVSLIIFQESYLLGEFSLPKYYLIYVSACFNITHGIQRFEISHNTLRLNLLTLK